MFALPVPLGSQTIEACCHRSPQRRQFQTGRENAHSSLALFKDDTGVKYGTMGLEPTNLALNVEHFREWVVVLADTAVTSSKHSWEVTVKCSQQFRVGVGRCGHFLG